MTDIHLTEKDIYTFIEEQKKNISVFSLLWEVMTPQSNEKILYFEFVSKPHHSNMVRPENFYKPLISIINFNENENL